MTAIKITFQLEQDEDGYPPFAVEDVWASSTEVPAHFVVDNIPFFARQATLGDTVRVVESGGAFMFDSVVARSSNSLVRVILHDPTRVDEVRTELRNLGCSTEAFEGIAILAVNVPGSTSLASVRRYLFHLREHEVAGFEEPILRDSVPTSPERRD